MRRAASLPAWPLLAALTAILLLASCGTTSDNPAHNVTESSRSASRPAWKPAGASPAVLLSSPGEGGSRSIRVGDRVRLPRVDGFGGLRLRSWRGLLVPYGDDRTYLAVGSGRVPVEDTVYDHERPCVPPQPVATFDLLIRQGSAPKIPPARHIGPDATGPITLTPGQELTYPAGWSLYGATGADSILLLDTNDGSYAVRPGTGRVTLAPPHRATDDRDRSFQVRVVAPDITTSAPSSTPHQAATTGLSMGAPGEVAAAPAVLPACA